MALSGSQNFSLNAREVITATLRKMGVLGVAQTLDADEAEDCRIELNTMLKGWQRHGPHLWKTSEGTIPLLASTALYSLFATLNPLRIMSMRYRDANSRDMPVRLFTREEYFDMPLKTSTGIPTQYYFDPQRGAPIVYVWPLLVSVTTEVLTCTYQKRMDDVDDLSNDVDIDDAYYDTLIHAFAKRLLPDFGVEGETAARIEKTADALLASAAGFDREDVVRFVPEYGYR
jgi:hypothetical protein